MFFQPNVTNAQLYTAHLLLDRDEKMSSCEVYKVTFLNFFRNAAGAGVPVRSVRGGVPRQEEQGRQIRRPGAGGRQGPPRVRGGGLHRVHTTVSQIINLL
jgi:hypothetical protein